MRDIITSTQDEIAGFEITDTLGLARGNIIFRAHRSLLREFTAVLRMYVGGEVVEYTEFVQEARGEAINRMLEHAESLGADAVVSVVMESDPEFLGQLVEIHVYGTAVKLRKRQASRKSPG